MAVARHRLDRQPDVVEGGVDWSQWLREVGDFTMLPNALVRGSGLSPGAFHLFCVVLSHRNRASGDCFPSREHIAEEMEFADEAMRRRRPSLDQLDRWKNELRENGYLDWSTKGGRNCYRVLVPPALLAKLRDRREIPEELPGIKPESPRLAQVRQLLDHFRGEHLRVTGSEYVTSQGRDRKIVGDLLDALDVDELRNVVTGFFLLDDPWLKQEGFSWPTLRAKLPKIQAKVRDVVTAATSSISTHTHEKLVDEAIQGGTGVDGRGLVKIR